MADTLYQNIVVTEKETSEIEITAEIPAEKVAPYKKQALKKLGENVSISGFRKGNIPEKVLVERLGELTILEEAAHLVLPLAYQQIIVHEKLSVIGRPGITITKLASDNPIAFKIETAVVPEVTLPDYKKVTADILAQKEGPAQVTEKEVEDVIATIQKQQAEAADQLPNKETGEKETLLPKLTDDFVKKLGNFKDVADFKAKLKDNLLKEKERKIKEQKRVQIGEAITKETAVSLPHILVESELDKMLASFKEDITRMGTTFDDYLKHLKKTEEDLRNEWKTDAEKRAKLQLVLNKIAEIENIKADRASVDREVEHLLTHFKDADPSRVRIYVETMLQNEHVFQFLEKDKANQTE